MYGKKVLVFAGKTALSAIKDTVERSFKEYGLKAVYEFLGRSVVGRGLGGLVRLLMKIMLI